MSDQLYVHLEDLIDALETLEVPVKVFASIEAVTNQGAPALYLIPEDCEVLQTIGDHRTITAWRLRQQWSIYMVLHDAGDQFVSTTLLESLGEWQASILNVLGTRLLTSGGGPLQVIEIPKPTVYAGGFLVGQIRLGGQFQFTVE